jgi:hypothetical protein
MMGTEKVQTRRVLNHLTRLEARESFVESIKNKIVKESPESIINHEQPFITADGCTLKPDIVVTQNSECQVIDVSIRYSRFNNAFTEKN